MRKVIGIGETIFDIIFTNGQPKAAVPGGSTFNSMIALGRAEVPVSFISETGNDRVGQTILEFMRANGVTTDYVQVYPESKSPVSLAFLNDRSDAEYLFYKDYPACRMEVDFPTIEPDDIVLFGSYFALNPVLRTKVVQFLDYARERGALIYYDVNFRSTHVPEIMKLAPSIIENLEYADIVRGSADDFRNLYNTTDVDRIYSEKTAFYCPRFICTGADKGVALRVSDLSKDYAVPAINPVSTIGAGDNFNAGIIFGLLREGIRRVDLDSLSEGAWDAVIRSGIDFATEACMCVENSVSARWVCNYIKQ